MHQPGGLERKRRPGRQNGPDLFGMFSSYTLARNDIVIKEPGVHPSRYPLHELENFEGLQLPIKGDQGVSSRRINIRDILERRYFSRVWIIQELILPPRIAIPVGDKIFWADALMTV